MQLRIVHTDTIAERTRLVRFEAIARAPLPAFAPGAHVEVTLETPSGTLVRQYSLVSSPDDPAGYEIAVLHTEASRGGSRFLHESVRVGDALEVSAPRGSFRLAPLAERHTLIAGGIGITPIRAFAAELRARGQDYRLLYAARSSGRMAFARELEDAHGARASFHVDRDGSPSLDLPQALGAPAEGHHAYVCGPRAMIEATRRAAEALGWRDDHVHVESFGAPTGRPSTPVTLRLAQSDLTLDVPAGASLLDAMEAAGAWVASECRRGECGKCTVGYTEGEVEHLDVCLTEEARRTQLCPCVSRARSSVLVLDA